ncbi:MAG: type II toxin-antitoxin system Phd/YefM family antitoxin [Candidatus Thiosymbion ectosymbiont of Robbea hypermnestra]|nr:type II toxin-antitoxin system Phd/YefM family antitoxin [Candidatus Thiosymbion ectosymbiont of Robbea hypermnestra]
MNFVSVRDFRTESGAVWEKLAQQHELVVTRNGKPFAVLTETSPTGRPMNRRTSFGEVLEAAWDASEQRETSGMGMEEIIAEIEATRRDHRAATGH